MLSTLCFGQFNSYTEVLGDPFCLLFPSMSKLCTASAHTYTHTLTLLYDKQTLYSTRTHTHTHILTLLYDTRIHMQAF